MGIAMQPKIAWVFQLLSAAHNKEEIKILLSFAFLSSSSLSS